MKLPPDDPAIKQAMEDLNNPRSDLDFDADMEISAKNVLDEIRVGKNIDTTETSYQATMKYFGDLQKVNPTKYEKIMQDIKTKTDTDLKRINTFLDCIKGKR
jgi:hypothetical protein